MTKTDQYSDSYSEKKAEKFRLYKWISLALLVLFLLGGLIFFESDITMENLRYLIKYLDFSGIGSYSEDVVIHYNADSSNRFYVFRGDMARVNERTITLYDRRGAIVMTDSFKMTRPVAVCGEKYLAVYDLGGHQLRIYNSFTMLHEKNFDYPLQSVHMNRDGEICVVTSEKSYHSAVFVYNRDFEEIHRWLTADRFAMDAHLTDNDRITITTVRALEGSLISELMEIKIGEKEAENVYAMTDQLPMMHSTDPLGTLLLSDRALKFIQNGEEIRSFSFEEGSVEMASFGDRYCAVLQDDLFVGVNFRLRIFNREGSEVASESFSVQVRDVEVYGENVYVLTHTQLIVLTPGESTAYYDLAEDCSDLGVLSDNTVLLCSDTFAGIRILNHGEQ